MKDETGDVPIKESLGLKPKVYSFLVDDRSENKKIKGLKKKSCLENNLHWIQIFFVE